MAVQPRVIQGTVRDGKIVLEGDVRLPEGLRVGIIFPHGEIPDDLKHELEAWDLAGEEAWAMIDAWEKEERV